MPHRTETSFFKITVRIEELRTYLRRRVRPYYFSELQNVSVFRKNPDYCPFTKSLNTKIYAMCARQKAMVTGYCVYEKKKNREIKSPKQIKLKNGRAAIKGICGSCGKPIFRIGKLTK